MITHAVVIFRSSDRPESSDLVSYLRRCASADYGVDRESQTRLTNEAAKVIAATLKLANGFVGEAVSDCNLLLHFNTGDQWCERYDTESQASFEFLFFAFLGGTVMQHSRPFLTVQFSVCV